jgi:hypothetical protein
MNDSQDRGAKSIDKIAQDIVDADHSNGRGRPGKKGPKGRLLTRPAVWLAGFVVVAAIIGIVLSVTLKSGAPSGGASTTRGFVGYVCQGHQFTLFNNINADAVSNGGSPPTFTTAGKAYCLMYIQTYHWNSGAGSPPGTVGLVRVSGPAALPKYIGSLPAKSSPGSKGVPNVNWYVSVAITKPVILDGTYSCADSDPSTWSSDKASGNAGFCLVYADLAIPPSK